MLVNLVQAQRAALLQHSVPPCAHMLAAQVRIRTLRRHLIWHATTSCWIMNDTVLDVRVHTQDKRARIRERRSVPARDASHHSLSNEYIFSILSQAVDATAFRLD